MRTRAALGTLAVLFALITAVIFFLVVPSEDALISREYNYGAPFFEGRKAKKYTGWSLADDDFTDNVDPRKARIVFYIMMAGQQDLAGLDVIFRTLYHVDHFFLIHLDVQAADNARSAVKLRVEGVMKGRGNGLPNVRLVEPATPITWGGFTMTLNAVYGLTQALHWNTKWDYFINLSASDLPLLRTDEIAGILGEHKVANVSFIKGFKYQPSWEGYKFVDRRGMFAEDVALMRNEEHEKRWPWAILDADKEMLTRQIPDMFTVYKGEFWVTLHRSMAEYVHKSPDNQARSLLAYFSGMMISDEEYFQTVACNPHFPRDKLRMHNDNLRFVNWWGNEASPVVMPPFRAVAAANSGAIFARKFSATTSEGKDGIRWVENYLADSSRSEARVARVKRRLATKITPEGEHVGFCGVAETKKPPETYFAVEGDEEKLAPESQSQPPRRGAGGWGEGGSFAPAIERSFEREQMREVVGTVASAGANAYSPSRLTFWDGRNGSGEAECGPQDSGDGCRGQLSEGDADDVPQSRPGVVRTEAFTDRLHFEPSAASVSRRGERLGGSGGGRISVDGFRNKGAHVTIQPNEGEDRRRSEGR